MQVSEIKQKVNTFLIEKLEMNEAIIRPESDLKRDLGMTSLDAVEISLFIKREFGFLPQKEDVKALVVLQDLYEYIEKNEKLS